MLVIHHSAYISFLGTRKSHNVRVTALPLLSQRWHCWPPSSLPHKLVRLLLSRLQARAYSSYITTSWDKGPCLTLFLSVLQTTDKHGKYKKEREQQRRLPPPRLPPPASEDSSSILQDVHNHYCRGNKDQCQLCSVIKQSLKLKPCT